MKKRLAFLLVPLLLLPVISVHADSDEKASADYAKAGKIAEQIQNMCMHTENFKQNRVYLVSERPVNIEQILI